MFILRPITRDDLDAFCDLAFSAKESITTLPKDKDLLLKSILHSQDSFQGIDSTVGHTKFLFVLENLENKELVGVSALKSDNAYTKSFKSFYLKGNKHPPTSLDLMSASNPYTELATLFLKSDLRKSGLSKLLAIGRYLFVAMSPLLFHEKFIARLRGAARKSPECPNSFWEQMGDIFDKNPFYPLHVNKFSQDVQELIGNVHPKTVPAYHLLLKQGFHCPYIYDLYDTGPRMECKRDEIKSIAHSQVVNVSEITPISEGQEAIISNNKDNFISTMDKITFSQKNPSHAMISPQASQALGVSLGDTVRYVPINLPAEES